MNEGCKSFVRKNDMRIGQEAPITVGTLLNDHSSLQCLTFRDGMTHQNILAKNLIVNEFEIFEAAIKITDQAERAAFLREACQGDQEMHIRIEVAIRSDFDAGLLSEPSETD